MENDNIFRISNYPIDRHPALKVAETVKQHGYCLANGFGWELENQQKPYPGSIGILLNYGPENSSGLLSQIRQMTGFCSNHKKPFLAVISFGSREEEWKEKWEMHIRMPEYESEMKKLARDISRLYEIDVEVHETY